ncbi:MAG TPA: class I SAM-dependent methyltransferase, partial [Gemmatimonadaceae bacterium]|nr:class I SAM-dependent methyltransferase [Gemmatimonadaceae bacterium]
LPLGARILDCPCGQGRHATLFADAGYDVTGADYSRPLLRVAQRDAGRGTTFVRADARELPKRWTGRFDAVFSLGASFGFFATPAEDAATLASYARVLGPGGVLVLHAANRDGVVSHFIEKDWWETESGTLVLHEREFDPLSGVLTVRVQLRGRSVTKRAYRMRLYTPTTLAERCAQAGLVVTEVFDGWRDRPVRRRSGEMVLVASKH